MKIAVLCEVFDMPGRDSQEQWGSEGIAPVDDAVFQSDSCYRFGILASALDYFMTAICENDFSTSPLSPIGDREVNKSAMA